MSGHAIKAWQDAEMGLHQGPVLEAANDFEVIDCAACRFKHVVPIPTDEELKAIYRHEYYTTEKPLYIERYLEDKEWWDSVYDARYDLLEQHLSAGRRRILDVGSGPGLFLLKGRERGWTVKGIEPSAQAAAYSRDRLGLDIAETFLDQHAAAGLGRFDAINMGEVVEHLPDPAAMLRLAHGLLDPGGLICLIAPNDFNPFQGVLREVLGFLPWWVAPPHHLNYFDFDSLAELTRRCGFEVLHREATFPIDMFLLMGQNYVGNDAIGRQCHGLRKNLELNLARSRSDLRRKLYTSLADHGIGREIVLFGRKP